MEITEIRIKLMNGDPNERLQAFCSITFDDHFVIRDLKMIQGTRGSFVAMPSRKLMDRCPMCSTKNHLRAQFCNDCGAHLHGDRALKADDGRVRLHADIAHPINSECRETIQSRVILAFAEEVERSELPGYTCNYDDFCEDAYARLSDETEEHTTPHVLLPLSTTIHRRDSVLQNQSASHHAGSLSMTANKPPYSLWSGPEMTTEEEVFGIGIV